MVFAWIEQAREDEARVFNSILGTKEPEKPKETLRDEILKHTAKSKPIKVGASDPGKQRDSFGFVGVKYDSPRILIIAAKRWLHHNYLTVEQKIADIHQQFNYDHQIIEINNTGIHVWEVLKYVNYLPVIGVNTSKNLNLDPNKRFDPFKFPSMDKNDMARWIHIQNEMGNLVFPKNPSKEMLELQNQIANIIEYKTEGTGSVSYKAEGKEHDDLYVALMLACWYIRENLMKPQAASPPVAVGARYYQGDDLDPTDRIIETIKKQMGNNLNITDVNVEFFQ